MGNTKTSVLQLEWKRREGGGGRTERDFLDFVVDGELLSEKIGGDLASCLGWFVPEENAKAVHRLMLKESADLPNNRYSLYVCPECGDLDCGAVTVNIERNGEEIIWRDFAFQRGYEADAPLNKIEEVDCFVFDRAQYRNTLRSAL